MVGVRFDWHTRMPPLMTETSGPVVVASSLAAVRARANAATAGPWRWDQYKEDNFGEGSGPQLKSLSVLSNYAGQGGARYAETVLYGPWTNDGSDSVDVRDEDAVFIAHAREDIPALLNLIDEIRQACSDQIAEYHNDDNAEMMSGRSAMAYAILEQIEAHECLPSV